MLRYTFYTDVCVIYLINVLGLYFVNKIIVRKKKPCTKFKRRTSDKNVIEFTSTPTNA